MSRHDPPILIQAGKPMLIVPFSHDQPDNGARMVRLGVARVIGRRQYSAASAAAAAQIQHENGAATAAEMIETVLRDDKPLSRGRP